MATPPGLGGVTPLSEDKSQASSATFPKGQASTKVLLLELHERTSAKGTVYLTGWLGKASVVAFSKEGDEGNKIWQVFVQPAPASVR